jgi:hypothetical protein
MTYLSIPWWVTSKHLSILAIQRARCWRHRTFTVSVTVRLLNECRKTTIA